MVLGKEATMDSFFQRVVIEPFDRLLERVLQFLPNVLIFTLIFITGLFLAFILKAVFWRIFRAIKLDRLSEKSGVGEMMIRGGLKEPISLIISKFIGWLTVIIFLFLSLGSLNVPAIDRILEKFILYLPNIFVAAFILFMGYLLGNFLGRAALIAAVNAGMKVSGLVGKLVKRTVILLALTMALEQLGIGKETIVIAFAIILGGVVLALAIAFGLGGRDIAKEYLEKKIKGEEKKDDIHHL
jgi:small-conductance mechanosensitive channel